MIPSKKPRFQIAVSRKITKSDTIWYAEKGDIYLATDGTMPSDLDQPWYWYRLDVQKAVTEGVQVEMDAYRWPIVFPRPEGSGTSRTNMTLRMVLELQKDVWKRGVVPRGTYFKIQMGGFTFSLHPEDTRKLDKALAGS